MKFTKVDIEQIKKKANENAIIVVSDGKAWIKPLPDFGETQVNFVSQNGKVQYITEETKEKTKLH